MCTENILKTELFASPLQSGHLNRILSVFDQKRYVFKFIRTSVDEKHFIVYIRRFQINRYPICVDDKRAVNRAHEASTVLYLSLSVRVHLITSGTQVTPHLLNLPSPIDRDTSNTPRTRPSLSTTQHCK